MSRLDEAIYWLEKQDKLYSTNPILFNTQDVMGEERLCCSVCGHCPAAEAGMLREIRDEVRANTEPKSKLAKGRE